jgi:hypothetical protein
MWSEPLPVEFGAIAVALFLAPLFVAAHVILSRLHDEDAPGQNDLLLAAALYAAAWVGAALALWGSILQLSQTIAGLATAGFVVLAYMQVYSQIGRGFSLRILVDIYRCGSLDIPGILREYSDGRSAQWLIDKRLTGLEHAGLATRRDNSLALRPPRGAWAGRAGLLFKRIVKPGQDG